MNIDRLLVVDDDLEKSKSDYIKFLTPEFFEVKFVGTKEDFENEKLSDFDAIILDVNLDNWARYTLKDACKLIGDSAPVILVSAELTNSAKIEDRIFSQLSSSPEVKVIQSFDLRMLGFGSENEREQTSNVYRTLTKVAISCFKDLRKRPLAVEDDDEINILHISDLQYGDPNTCDWSEYVEQSIAKHLEDTVPFIHLVVISGDIAFSGRENEYVDAKRGILRLCNSLWNGTGQKFIDRIIIVPGNHDIDFRFSAIPHNKLDFSEAKEKDQVSTSFELDNSSSTTEESCKLGLLPFRRFAMDLYNDDKWLNKNSLNWVEDKFNYLGLRFILLNSAEEISCSNISLANIKSSSVDEITGFFENTSSSELFTLAVSHHGCEDPVHEKNSSIKDWPRVANLLRLSKTDVWLHGHGHKRLVLKQEYGEADTKRAKEWFEKTEEAEKHFLNRDEEFIRIMAPSTHVNEKLRPENERKGFCLVKLKRYQKQVSQVIVVNYDYHDKAPQKTIKKTFMVPD